jgi:hypothetical protein
MSHNANESFFRPAIVMTAVVLFSLIVPLRVRGEQLYQTGFEPPQFTASQTVDGQGGFAVTTGSPGAITITTLNPFAGTQSLLFTGSNLSDQGGGFYVGTAGVAMSYDAVANGNPLIILESHVLLDGPSTNMGPGSGTSGDLVSVNMEAILSDGSYFSTYLSSDGNAYGFTTNYDFSTPVTLGVYHDLKLVIDFASKESTFFADGQAFGTQPFDPSVSSTVLSSAQFSMYAIDPPADRTMYSAHVDNFSVDAVPEPSGFALAVIGLLAVAGRWGGRHRSAWRQGPRLASPVG